MNIPKILESIRPGEQWGMTDDSYGSLVMITGTKPTIEELEAAWPSVQQRMDAETIRAVTMRQARLVLLQSGLLPTVNAAVASMTGTAGEAARITWEFSSEVQRSSPFVEQLAKVLKLTDAQLDDLFRLAATL